MSDNKTKKETITKDINKSSNNQKKGLEEKKDSKEKETEKIIIKKTSSKEKEQKEKIKYKLNFDDIDEYPTEEKEKTSKQNEEKTKEKITESKNEKSKEKTPEQKEEKEKTTKEKEVKVKETISKEKAIDNKDKNKQKKKSTNKKRRKRKKKLKIKAVIILLLMIITIVILSILIVQKKEKQQTLEAQEKLLEQIESHYNEYVITEKEVDIYELKNDKYEKVGKIGKEQELTLTKKYLTYEDEYFEIETFKEKYYIHYKDVKKIDSLKEIKKTEQRYKKYIPFNINIITKDTTNFYDEENNLIYSFNKSFELPVIIKKDNLYGVEYNNKLLYVKKEDVKEKKENKNTDKENTKGIAVLNYHFFNNSDDPTDSCNQIICLSTNNLKKHLDYIKDNDIFTPSMKELEMYIDGFIQLPKSVVLTIDDGWRAKIGSEVITEYELNATIFLMSKHYDPRNYQNDYIEVHSHGHDIHEGGVCPGGQGGAIKCLEKTKLLEDLNASRDKLNNTTYFCYPFYEYNDYSISVLKEAGFTMAFGGSGEGGNYKVKPGINKFKLPRYVIYNYTTANTIATYID